MTLPTHYEVLGVDRKADTTIVRRAYRRLARKYHPDVNPDPLSHDQMAKINEAFSTLTNPSLRQEYDALLAGSYEPPKTTPRKPMVVRLRERLHAHRTPIYALTFSPDGNILVSGAFDNEVIWWKSGSQIERRQKMDYGVVSTLQGLPHDRVVAAGAVEGQVALWDVRHGDVASWRNQAQEWVCCLAISPNGQYLATGSAKKRLTVTNTETFEIAFENKDHGDAVTALAWSPDGKVLASGSGDATVKLWSVPNGRLLKTILAIRSQVTALAFSPDARFLAVAAVDLSIRVFSLADGTLQKMMFGHTKPIEAVAFHKNGWLFASAGREGAVKLWNADKGIGQLHIDASHLPVLALAFSPDGETLAAGGLDKTIRLWDVKIKDPAE